MRQIWPSGAQAKARAIHDVVILARHCDNQAARDNALDSLRNFYKKRWPNNRMNMTSWVLDLHHRVTVLILVLASLTISIKQYGGRPIECVVGRDLAGDVVNNYCWVHSTYSRLGQPALLSDMKYRVVTSTDDSAGVSWFERGVLQIYPGVGPGAEDGDVRHHRYYQWAAGFLIFQDVLNTFCWIHSTYTIKTAFSKQVGKEVPYPGVDNSRGSVHDQKCYRYYQWVCFCLFFQAILFYTPRWLWKNWEGGKINSLMMDLDIGICSKEEKNLKTKLLSDYLLDNLKLHNWWAYKYFLCEVLALGNVIGQMFLMNRFFDGEFFNFGINVIKFMESDEEDRTDPMIFIFPRMTKCTFYKFGVSGEIERHDAVCILPLNVVNEKIYIFLWFWFLGLGALTLGVVFYRIVIISSPRMRLYLLHMRFRLVRKEALSILVKESKMGDWFLFYMLGVNVDSIIFRDVMHDLAKRLQHHGGHHDPTRTI